MNTEAIQERIIAAGFDVERWQQALARKTVGKVDWEREHEITLAHPVNWLTEEEAETPYLVEALLDSF